MRCQAVTPFVHPTLRTTIQRRQANRLPKIQSHSIAVPSPRGEGKGEGERDSILFLSTSTASPSSPPASARDSSPFEKGYGQIVHTLAKGRGKLPPSFDKPICIRVHPCSSVVKNVFHFATFGKLTSADMPARSLPSELSRRTLIPKTCFTRSPTVCTLRGVNSASRAICSTAP
jgi:hypothetical protein